MTEAKVELGPELKRYWEFEKPQVIRTDSNEFRWFKECKKLQIYAVVPNAPRGIGKGVTIDLTKIKNQKELVKALGFEV